MAWIGLILTQGFADWGMTAPDLRDLLQVSRATGATLAGGAWDQRLAPSPKGASLRRAVHRRNTSQAPIPG